MRTQPTTKSKTPDKNKQVSGSRSPKPEGHKIKPTSLRLNPTQKQRLQEISEKVNITESDLVRIAVDDLLDKVSKEGMVTIPLIR